MYPRLTEAPGKRIRQVRGREAESEANSLIGRENDKSVKGRKADDEASHKPPLTVLTFTRIATVRLVGRGSHPDMF
jgi:hypothetical protein